MDIFALVKAVELSLPQESHQDLGEQGRSSWESDAVCLLSSISQAFCTSLIQRQQQEGFAACPGRLLPPWDWNWLCVLPQ